MSSFLDSNSVQAVWEFAAKIHAREGAAPGINTVRPRK
jgi:hypothetical protein